MSDFKEGDWVLAYHGSVLYKAKIVRVTDAPGKRSYRIHYDGWAKTHDEWVDEDETRLLPVNEATLAQKARLEEEAKGRKKTRSDGQSAKPAKRAAGEGGRDLEDDMKAADAHGSLKVTLPLALKRALVEDWQNVTQSRMLLRLPRPATAISVGAVCDAFVAHVQAGGVLSADKEPSSRSRKKPRLAVPEPTAASSTTSDAAVAAATATIGEAATDGAPAAAMEVFVPGAALDAAPADTPAASASSSEPTAAAKAAKDILDGLREYFDRALPVALLYRFERQQYDALMAGRDAGDTRPLHEVYGAELLLRLFVRLPELLAHASLNAEQMGVLRSTLDDLMKFIAKNASTYFVADNYAKAPPEYCEAFDNAVKAAAIAGHTRPAAATQPLPSVLGSTAPPPSVS